MLPVSLELLHSFVSLEKPVDSNFGIHRVASLGPSFYAANLKVYSLCRLHVLRLDLKVRLGFL